MNILSIRNVVAFRFQFQFNVKTEKKILSCAWVCEREMREMGNEREANVDKRVEFLCLVLITDLLC